MAQPQLTGIENFRDFGGYRLPNGRRVRPGLLFRSAHLHFASAEDVATLEQAGISHVVDLRSSAERGLQPCAPGIAAMVRMIDTGETPGRTEAPDASVDGLLYMKDQYRRIPFDVPHLLAFGRFFEILADAPSGVLIHCAAGKDRTGLLAALTLYMLGADIEDIKTDYMLTNTRDIEPRLPAMKRYLEAQLGHEISDALVRAMLGVDASWLDAGFEAIADRCGSIDAYYEDMLGVTPARRAAIIEHATEPA